MMTSYDTNAQIDWNLTSGKNQGRACVYAKYAAAYFNF